MVSPKRGNKTHCLYYEPMSKYPFNYYAKVARSKGVPDMWIEDAVQDMLLHMWLTGDTEEHGIKHRAVDAMRKYGPQKQGGRNGYVYTGPTFTELDDAEYAVVGKLPYQRDQYAVVDEILSFDAAWAGLTDRNREIIVEAYHHKSAAERSVSDARVAQVKKLIREAVRA